MLQIHDKANFVNAKTLQPLAILNIKFDWLTPLQRPLPIINGCHFQIRPVQLITSI
jgi:hypothetical protein